MTLIVKKTPICKFVNFTISKFIVELRRISAIGGCASGAEPFFVELRRIELPTYSLRTNRSPKLSYSPNFLLKRIQGTDPKLSDVFFMSRNPAAVWRDCSTAPSVLTNIMILRPEFNNQTAQSPMPVDIPLNSFFKTIFERGLCCPSKSMNF